jgi:hypothetical protein
MKRFTFFLLALVFLFCFVDAKGTGKSHQKIIKKTIVPTPRPVSNPMYFVNEQLTSYVKTNITWKCAPVMSIMNQNSYTLINCTLKNNIFNNFFKNIYTDLVQSNTNVSPGPSHVNTTFVNWEKENHVQIKTLSNKFLIKYFITEAIQSTEINPAMVLTSLANFVTNQIFAVFSL